MKPKYTRPTAKNKFYNTKGNGGYSTCIKGKPTVKDLDVLSNCVGYACGRFNEIIGEMKYPQLNCNAGVFIERAISIGLSVVKEPVQGGIMVWGHPDWAGHVEVVEEMPNKDTAYTSASNYGSTAYYTNTRRRGTGTWGLGGKYYYRGCIVNPAVPIKVPPKPKPQPATLKYKVGDDVMFTKLGSQANGGHVVNALVNHGVIGRTYAGAERPYLIGKNIGFVNDVMITGLYKAPAKPKPKPTAPKLVHGLTPSGVFKFKLDVPTGIVWGTKGLKSKYSGVNYTNGQQVKYQSVYVQGGHVWLAYKASDGTQCSVAVGKTGGKLWGKNI